MSDDMMIGTRIQEVHAAIEAARARRTSIPKDAPVELIAVTKNHPVEAMQAAIDAGIGAHDGLGQSTAQPRGRVPRWAPPPLSRFRRLD